MRDTLRGLKLLSLFWGFILLFTVIISINAHAAINPQINFQGKLTNTDGTNVTNGTYSIVFSIYTVSSGGSAVWTETQSSVSVTDGIFRVALGSVTSLPGSVDFNGSSLYLGIKVGADAEMTPRVQFTASPYAFNSDRLGGVQSTGFVQLGQSASPQSDSSTNNSIYINKTATGNLMLLQSAGTAAFTITNSGDVTFGENGNKTISIAQESTNAAGNSLTLVAGQGGAGASANAGGALILQAGAGGGTNGAGGNLTLAAGAGSGSGVVGSVILKNPANSTTSFMVQNASTIELFSVDTSNNRVYIGDTGGDTTGTILVLDNKTDAAEPTGVVGGMYYNTALNSSRCYETTYWADCSTTRLLGETTLGTANATISITLAASTEYLECRIDTPGRSAAGTVNLRLNNASGAGTYNWNVYGIVAAAVTDWQSTSDTEIQLTGTQTGNVPFSADVKMTNFTTTAKAVDWTATDIVAVATNMRRYSGGAAYYNTTSQISSVQFLTSTGTFNAGSHAWCQGRNIR